MNITGEETLDELDAMLAQYDDAEIDTADSQAPDGDSSPQDETAAGTAQTEPEENPGETGAPPASEPEPDENIVLARDGKNIIPYAVLEAERAEKAAAQQRLAELEAQLADTKLRTQLLQNQISRAGMKPQDSPQALQLEADKIARMREEYPDMADALDTLAARTEHLEQLYQQQISQQQQAQQQAMQRRALEAQTALESNPTLTQWRDSDPQRFNFACQIDSLLETDPDWGAKPYAERFAEVTRRTLAAFNDPLPASAPPQIQAQQAQKLLCVAQQKAQKTLNSDSLPDSPSQVGTQAETPKTPADRLASASTEELYAMMNSMTPEQIEELLAGSL